MKWASKIILFGFLLGVFTTSCDKKECSDPVPKMTFMQFVPSQTDSGNYLLVFEFSDCDGDMGMETSSSIRDENGELQTNNFMLDLYHIVNNQWVKHEFDSTDAGLDYKIPILGNSNLNPSLEGEIERKLDPVFGLVGYDSVMFKARILDNAGHYSNEVETPGFIIN
ncbi:MAG: hypothetical protein ACI9GM_001395 [Salibacteraceae bacterium]|jgi:hypothetical protein